MSLEKLLGRLKSDDKSVEEVQDAYKPFDKARNAFLAEPSPAGFKEVEKKGAAMASAVELALKQIRKRGGSDDEKTIRQLADELKDALAACRDALARLTAEQADADKDAALEDDESKLLDPARTRGIMRKSAKTPMPFCWVEKEDGSGILVMDKSKAPKALMEKVRKETKGSRGTFGQATLNQGVLFLNLEGKTLPSLEKQVKAWLKDNKPMPASDCSLRVEGVTVDDETGSSAEDAAAAAKRWKEFQTVRASLEKAALSPEVLRQAEAVMKDGDKWAAGNIRDSLKSYAKQDARAKDLFSRAEAAHKAASAANVTVRDWPSAPDYAGTLKLRNVYAKEVKDQIKAAGEGRRENIVAVPQQIRDSADELWEKAQEDTKRVLMALKAKDGALGVVGDAKDARKAMKEIAAVMAKVEAAHASFEEEARALLHARSDGDRSTRPEDRIEPVMQAHAALEKAAKALSALLAAHPS